MNQLIGFPELDFSTAYLIVDAQGEILDMNEQALSFLQLDGSTDRPEKIDEIFVDLNRESAHKCLSSTDAVYTLRHKQLHELLFQIKSIPLPKEQFLFLFRPLTSWTELFKKNQQQRKELEQFIYSISHDLTAPVRGITTLSQWLVDDFKSLLDEEQQETISLLQEKTKQLNDLIQAILVYSRVGRLSFSPKWIAIKPLLKGVLEKHQEQHPEFSYHLPDHDCKLFIDKRLATQLFEQLISNAITHNTKPSKKIIINFISTDINKIVTLEDNGDGIPPKVIDRVFDIFFKHTKIKHSLGFGLTLANKIMRVSNGDIQIKSEENIGTQVRLSFPIR